MGQCIVVVIRNLVCYVLQIGKGEVEIFSFQLLQARLSEAHLNAPMKNVDENDWRHVNKSRYG